MHYSRTNYYEMYRYVYIYTHISMCSLCTLYIEYMGQSATRRTKLPQRLSHVCVLRSILMYSFRAVCSTKVSCQNGSFVGRNSNQTATVLHNEYVQTACPRRLLYTLSIRLSSKIIVVFVFRFFFSILKSSDSIISHVK